MRLKNKKIPKMSRKAERDFSREELFPSRPAGIQTKIFCSSIMYTTVPAMIERRGFPFHQ